MGRGKSCICKINHPLFTNAVTFSSVNIHLVQFHGDFFSSGQKKIYLLAQKTPHTTDVEVCISLYACISHCGMLCALLSLYILAYLFTFKCMCVLPVSRSFECGTDSPEAASHATEVEVAFA